VRTGNNTLGWRDVRNTVKSVREMRGLSLSAERLSVYELLYSTCYFSVSSSSSSSSSYIFIHIYHVESMNIRNMEINDTVFVSTKTYVTSRKVAGSISDEVIAFFNWPNLASRKVVLRSTQPLTELSTRNHPGCNGRSAHNAGILTAICETIV
jgi:hypothetical protein